jgi:hypothetical protein
MVLQDAFTGLIINLEGEIILYMQANITKKPSITKLEL